MQVFIGEMIEHFNQIFASFPLGHGQVVEHVVAAVMGGGTGNVAFKIGNKVKGFLHEWHNIGRLQVAFHKQVVARATPHGPPIHNFVAPLLVVAQECGGKVLDGVQGRLADGRFAVGQLHAYVECGDYITSIQMVFSRHIDATLQLDVVDGETFYFFHCCDCFYSSDRMS